MTIPLVLWGGVASAEVIEHIAAVINQTTLIFQSDVERDRTFFAPSPGTDKNALKRVIDFHLLLMEARRLVPEGPTNSAIAEMQASVRARFPDEKAFEEALTQQGLSANRLHEILHERAWVARFLRERISALAWVSEKEVEQYAQNHSALLREKEGIRRPRWIRHFLTVKQAIRETRKYLAHLRRRAILEINPKAVRSSKSLGSVIGIA